MGAASRFRSAFHPFSTLDITMKALRSIHRNFALAASSVLLTSTLVACPHGNPTQASPVAGTYVATVLRATPTGQAPIDVLAQGGTLSIVVAPDFSTTGMLTIPASIVGRLITASMEGSATVTGSTVTFQQSADTFIRDLTFTMSGNTLTTKDQPRGGATYTITLKRQ